MSAHDLLNMLRTRDKMRGLQSIFSLWQRVQLIQDFFFLFLRNVIMDLDIRNVTKSVNYQRFIDLLHGFISLPDATACEKQLLL